MKRYTIDSKFVYWLYVAIIPCLFLAVSIFFLVMDFRSPNSGPPVWFFVLWLAAVLYSCYRTVAMPHTIDAANEGSVKFTGPFRRTIVTPHDIARIKAFSGQFLEVKHTRGKFWTLQKSRGFASFSVTLRARAGA